MTNELLIFQKSQKGLYSNYKITMTTTSQNCGSRLVANLPFLLLLTLATADPAPAGISGNFTCPAADLIWPCTCEIWDVTAGDLECRGVSISEDMVTNLFSLVKQLNPPLPNGRTKVSSFRLHETNLTTFDLVPCFDINFGYFLLSDNPYLYGITVSESGLKNGLMSKSGTTRMSINFLKIEYNKNVKDLMLNVLLLFVDPDSVHEMELKRNYLTGGSVDDTSIFSMISFLQDLQTLDLGENRILRLVGGQLQKNNRLTQLLLDENLMAEIGHMALHFDPPPADMVDTRLRIYLGYNRFTDDWIHVDNGWDKIGRPVTLDLQSNYFDFISAQKFEPFLKARPDNELRMLGCPFFCDERMRWLRDQKDDFEPRTIGIDCINDPGKNIFNTDLLS